MSNEIQGLRCEYNISTNMKEIEEWLAPEMDENAF